MQRALARSVAVVKTGRAGAAAAAAAAATGSAAAGAVGASTASSLNDERSETGKAKTESGLLGKGNSFLCRHVLEQKYLLARTSQAYETDLRTALVYLTNQFGVFRFSKLSEA